MALLKLGVSYTEILDLPEGRARALVLAHEELLDPTKTKKKSIVRKKRP